MTTHSRPTFRNSVPFARTFALAAALAVALCVLPAGPALAQAPPPSPSPAPSPMPSPSPAPAPLPPLPIHGVHSVPCDEIDAEHADAVERVRRGFLGIELSPLTPDLLDHFGVAADEGVMISKLVPGSAAESAGLQVGDVITRFDGDVIRSTRDLGRRVRDQAGETVRAEVWRDGVRRTLSVTIGEREMCKLDIARLMRDVDVDMEVELEELSRLAAEVGAEGARMGAEIAEEVARAMAEIDWEAQMHSLEKLEEIDEERMEELQVRLQELETRLEREFEDFEERYGKELERAMEERERAMEAKEREIERHLEQIEREQERREEMLERHQEELERRQEAAERGQEKAEEGAEGGGSMML